MIPGSKGQKADASLPARGFLTSCPNIIEFDKREQDMKSAAELEKNLMSINRRSYPAYKDLRGSYQFQGYQLNIDHVQGDPFASPSKLSLHVKGRSAGFPASFYDTKYKQVALCDHLTRLFYQTLSKISFRAKGSGKTGLLSVRK